MRSFRRARMAQPARHLDDNGELVEEEVDSGNMALMPPEHHLCPRPRQARLADQLEESPLEHRVTTRIGDQVLDEAATAAPGSSKAGESSLQHFG